MTTHCFFIGWWACCAGLLCVTVCEAGPRVAVVMQDDAPALEKHAANELTAQWKQLFDADVQISPTPAADAVVTILLGSPTTNAAVKTAFGDKWPKLTDQGHLIRTVTPGQQTVVVSGGSPVATLWAVYELSHHFGVRSLLHGDYYPLETPKLSVDKLDIVMEPRVEVRGFMVFNDLPIGFGGWGLADQQRLLGQLTKLKFNRVIINVDWWQPIIAAPPPPAMTVRHFMLGPVEFPVTGDTPGRSAFRGAKRFENPDIPAHRKMPTDFNPGQKYIKTLIDSTHQSGMQAVLQISPVSLPVELRGQFDTPSERMVKVGNQYTTTALDTFPSIDVVVVDVPHFLGRPFLFGDTIRELREKTVAREWGVTDGNVGVRNLPAGIGVIGSIEEITLFDGIPGKRYGRIPLGKSNRRILPSVRTTIVEETLQKLADIQSTGFLCECDTPADIDPELYYLSRLNFIQGLSFEQAVSDLITPICGEDVSAPVYQALGMIAEAAAVLRRESKNIGSEYEMIGLHFEKIPHDAIWPAKVRTLYTNAMNEMYRANSRSRGGARAITLYYAKRCEFGLHFMTCVEALQKSRKPGLSDDEITAQLEAAHEALYSAQNALAEVARDQSDRGIIAVVNEFGYRPLKKALEAR